MTGVTGVTGETWVTGVTAECIRIGVMKDNLVFDHILHLSAYTRVQLGQVMVDRGDRGDRGALADQALWALI